MRRWPADATLLFFKSVNLTGYYALTNAPESTGARTKGASYRGRFDFNDDRFGFSAEHMLIDRDFRPEVGYVRRTDVRRSFGLARFSPRPKNSKRIRKLTWQGSLDYVTDAPAIALQNRESRGSFVVDFQSSDQLSFEYIRDHELLPSAFTISPGVVVPGEQPRPVQRGRQQPQLQRAAPLGIHRRQRAVCHVQRWPKHARSRVAEPPQSDVRDQGDAAAQILTELGGQDRPIQSGEPPQLETLAAARA